MNIRQLQYFCSVVKLGSFSRAAQEQGVSVQAVSKAIVELERELGQELFTRGSKGADPTPFGWSLMGYAEKALGSIGEIERFAQEYPERNERKADIELGIAVPPFKHSDKVCAGLAKLFERHMRASVRIQVCMGYEALSRLKARSMDALFTVGRFDAPGCNCLVIGTVPAGAFMSKRHPLRRKKTVTFADLEPYPVLYGEGVDDFNETVLNLYARHGLASPQRSVRSADGMKEFLDRDNGYLLGVGIPTFTVVKGTVMHAFDPADAVPVPVCMTALSQTSRSDLMQRLDEFARAELPSMLRKL